MATIIRSIGALALALLVACGSGGGVSTRRTRTAPDQISRAELESLAGLTARQAIERLRPRFLTVRGPTSLTNPNADRIIVYVDGTRMGGVEHLEMVQVTEVQEIRYLNPADATNRYGTGHSAGVIVVVRR